MPSFQKNHYKSAGTASFDTEELNQLGRTGFLMLWTIHHNGATHVMVTAGGWEPE